MHVLFPNEQSLVEFVALGIILFFDLGWPVAKFYKTELDQHFWSLYLWAPLNKSEPSPVNFVYKTLNTVPCFQWNLTHVFESPRLSSIEDKGDLFSDSRPELVQLRLLLEGMDQQGDWVFEACHNISNLSRDCYCHLNSEQEMCWGVATSTTHSGPLKTWSNLDSRMRKHRSKDSWGLWRS